MIIVVMNKTSLKKYGMVQFHAEGVALYTSVALRLKVTTNE